MRKHVRRSGRGEHERGTAMIEASLTLTVFLLFTLSLVDFGISLLLHQTFMHQARCGARYGALNPGNTTAIKNVVLYSSTTGSGNGAMGLTPSSVTVTRTGTPSGPDDRIVVTISGYTFTWITPGWAGKHTGKPIVVTMPVEN
jgi:hypothetical protein